MPFVQGSNGKSNVGYVADDMPIEDGAAALGLAADNYRIISEDEAVKLQAVATNSILPYDDNNGGDDNMKERIAVLEAEVGHIKADIADIKQDMREVKTDIKGLVVALAGVNASISLVKWLIPILISLAIGIGVPLAFRLLGA